MENLKIRLVIIEEIENHHKIKGLDDTVNNFFKRNISCNLPELIVFGNTPKNEVFFFNV
jgi:hypothetical protein